MKPPKMFHQLQRNHQPGPVLAENFRGKEAGPWKMSTVERQKMQLRNNSRTTCIAEPKQSLHEENMFPIMILSSQKWGLGKTGGPALA